MKHTTRQSLAIAGVLAIAVIGGGIGNTPDASAQTATTVVECPDCIGANSGVGGSPGLEFSWACELDSSGEMTGQGRHVAVARVPAKWAGPVTFDFPLATPPLVVVQPGRSATLTIAFPGGAEVYWVGRIFGPGVDRLVNQGGFDCPCGEPTTTTPTTSAPPVSTTSPPVTLPPASTPGTTAPPSSVVPGTPSTAPVNTLPATGGGSDVPVLAALALCAAGALALYAARVGREAS